MIQIKDLEFINLRQNNLEETLQMLIVSQEM